MSRTSLKQAPDTRALFLIRLSLPIAALAISELRLNRLHQWRALAL